MRPLIKRLSNRQQAFSRWCSVHKHDGKPDLTDNQNPDAFPKSVVKATESNTMTAAHSIHYLLLFVWSLEDTSPVFGLGIRLRLCPPYVLGKIDSPDRYSLWSLVKPPGIWEVNPLFSTPAPLATIICMARWIVALHVECLFPDVLTCTARLSGHNIWACENSWRSQHCPSLLLKASLSCQAYWNTSVVGVKPAEQFACKHHT